MTLLGFLLLFYFSATLMSQTAMDLAALLLLAWSIWISRKGPKLYGTRCGFEWGFAVWIAIVIIGFLLNGTVESDHIQHRLFEFYWILLIYIFALAFNWRPIRRADLRWLAPVFCLCCLYAISISVLGRDPMRPERKLDWIANGTMRTGGFLGQPIVFAHLYGIYLTLLMTMFLGRLAQFVKSRKFDQFDLVLSVSVLCGAGALLLSFTRGAWLGLWGAMAVLVWILARRYFFKLSGIFILILAGLSAFWPEFRQRLLFSVIGGDSERIYIWKANIAMFADHPVFGVGYGENTELLRKYFEQIGAPSNLLVAHAHNQYLNFLSGTGVVGLAIYILFLGYFTYQAWLNWDFFSSLLKSKEQITEAEVVAGSPIESTSSILDLGAFAVQIYFILGGLTESNFEHAKMKYAMTLVWGYIFYRKNIRLKSARL